MKVGFLGPRGTFSEDAARLYAQRIHFLDCEFVPFSNFVGVGEAVLEKKNRFRYSAN